MFRSFITMRIIFVICFAVIIIVLLFLSKPEQRTELRSLPAQSVEVDTVKRLDIQPVTRVTGKLQPARKASVHFQVTGQINARHIEPGQYVEEGTPLLEIDNGDFADAVDESSALLKTESNTIARDLKLLQFMIEEKILQQKEVRRYEQLSKESLSAAASYDQALKNLYRLQAEEARLQHSVDSSNEQLKIAQANLSKAKRNFDRTRLLAPFNGTINAVYVDVGDYVSPGDRALELVQINMLDLSLEVAGSIISALYLGQTIVVDTKNGKRKGEIIGLTVDPNANTNTYAVKIRIPAKDVFPGQLAVAELPGQHYKNANTVPSSAILYEEGNTYLFELVDGHVEKKQVTLIDRYLDLFIVDGVTSGSLIISRDVSALSDQQRVIRKSL